MANNADVHSVSLAIVSSGTIAVGTTNIYWFRSPTAVNGGGITVLGAWFTDPTAHAAGSAPYFRLLRYSGGGTPAVAGTIAAAGTLTAAGTPTAFTISSAFVDANSWVVVEKAGTIATSVGLDTVLTLQYVMGY